jgi:hypothetical protein
MEHERDIAGDKDLDPDSSRRPRQRRREESGNPGGALMAVYDAHTLEQLRLLATSICVSLAVDHLGYVYAGCGTIYVYAPGATQQSRARYFG